MKPFRSLRAQLAVAMVCCILATVAMASATAGLLMALNDQRLQRSLPDRARDAQAMIEASPTPDRLDAYARLLESEHQRFAEQGPLEGPILAGVVLIAVLAGCLVAIFLARRFARQLELISWSAQRVATGDLSARAIPSAGAADEILDLMANFNRLAEALERHQAHAIESSAAIAHELRTPLAILIGRLQGMQDGVFPAGKDAVAPLIRQVEALTKIVSDLELVSMASAGRFEISAAEIDVAAELEALIADVKPQLEADGLSIELALRPALALADPFRVKQATLALLENVVRHAASGGVLRVETEMMLDGQAVIRVLDRGPGLPSTDTERLFEPFWRYAGSGRRKTGGAGLGLSVVASIAKAHGGRVQAAPRDSGGAVFSLTLPGSEALNHRTPADRY